MTGNPKNMKRAEPVSNLSFIGKPMSVAEAKAKWPLRYTTSKTRKTLTLETPNGGNEERLQAEHHYEQAVVDAVLFHLGDDVYVMVEEGKPNYIAKIVEFFEAIDGEPYFRARWFYRPEDTLIRGLAHHVQKKRVFLSNVEDDNPLNCIVSKVRIVKLPLKIASETEDIIIPQCDFYYDLNYDLAHHTFSTSDYDQDVSSTISSECDSNTIETPIEEKLLLDLYSGCGAMSTGLCIGASLSGIKLITKWAVDINKFACDSLKLNHPETAVRNEASEDFLSLLKEWRKLCIKFALTCSSEITESVSDLENEEEDGVENDDADGNSDESEIPSEEFEVGEFIGICFGDPNGVKKFALHLKVRWKGYGPDEDTWEPYDGLEHHYRNTEHQIVLAEDADADEVGYKRDDEDIADEDIAEFADFDHRRFRRRRHEDIRLRLPFCLLVDLLVVYTEGIKEKSKKTSRVVVHEGLRPEIYTEEHEKLLGNTKQIWTCFVDGYAKDGKRIYDPIKGKTYHQCRQKTLGYRTCCSQCDMVQGQFCGDCLFMRKCKDKLKEFVTKGFNSKLLPLPGDAHFVCGGPPCQGVSGFNRFRNKDAPLEDEKNHQLLVYMDIINFLKPDYVLMENVVDLLKFSEGFLARYAVARLVAMNYQTRLGMMTAGSYGIPQIRNRVFLWGAQPTKKLPPYPLPTHEILNKSLVPTEFEEIQVGHSQKNLLQLEKALTLADAISDLPPATNHEEKDERNYGKTTPKTDFQKYISLKRSETLIPITGRDASQSRMLYDHQPLKLKEDDFERVSLIPKKKGANFRDLGGVLVENNRVKFDPTVERPKVKSGKFLVPDYAMSFVHGRSKKPFGRLWWDEIVNTVVTRAEPHNQCVIHPLQDRVLTVRENARIQGFPDFYKLCGSIKEKYIQVGNAVAVPVGVALGYAFGMASQGLVDDQPVIKLPFKYPKCLQGIAEENSD